MALVALQRQNQQLPGDRRGVWCARGQVEFLYLRRGEHFFQGGAKLCPPLRLDHGADMHPAQFHPHQVIEPHTSQPEPNVPGGPLIQTE